LAKKVAELFRPGPVEEKKVILPQMSGSPAASLPPSGARAFARGFERSNSMGKNSKLRLFFFCDPDNLKKESSSKGEVCPKLGRTYVRPGSKLSLLFRQLSKLYESLILQGFEKAVFGVVFFFGRPAGRKKKVPAHPQSKVVLWPLEPRCAPPRFRDFRASAISGLVRFQAS
jgi:hypothetical protein